MQVQHSEQEDQGRFFIEIGGQIKAEMTYSVSGSGTMVIDHTGVDASLKGQGIGYKLVEASVNYARHKQLKIMPLCSFVVAVFKKRPEYGDVLKE